jgi:flagellar biosynthesis/type III secretory pathway M-ring protein FliF/YscJ
VVVLKFIGIVLVIIAYSIGLFFVFRHMQRRHEAKMAAIDRKFQADKKAIEEAHRVRTQQLDELLAEMVDVAARQRRGEIGVVEAMNAFDNIQRRTDQLFAS